MLGIFVFFVYRIFYLPLQKRPSENALGSAKKHTQKTQKSWRGIFVFFAYTFAASDPKQHHTGVLSKEWKTALNTKDRRPFRGSGG